jgi:hypothetical protein
MNARSSLILCLWEKSRAGGELAGPDPGGAGQKVADAIRKFKDAPGHNVIDSVAGLLAAAGDIENELEPAAGGALV